jgi:structure-specific recognition protein 1
MTTIQQSMNQTLQLLEQHTEKIIRDLAAEHGFDADEAIQKFITNSSHSSTSVTLKKKKAKKVRDPNKPKRSKNAFMFFSAAKRAEIKESNPDMKSTDISKQLGLLWKALSDDDKKPFELLAATEKEAYDKAMAAYKETSDSD